MKHGTVLAPSLQVPDANFQRWLTVCIGFNYCAYGPAAGAFLDLVLVVLVQTAFTS